MANNCQMMCVMKAESVLWSLRSHPSLTDLIGYANEGQSETVSDSKRSAYTLLAFRTFMATHTHCISLNPNPVLICKKEKKEKKSLSPVLTGQRLTLSVKLVKNPQGDGCWWPVPWALQHSVTHKVQSIALHPEDRDPGERKHGAATRIPEKVSRHDRMAGFCGGNASLSPALGLRDVSLRMIHNILMCN